jgi:cyclohexanecarboxylate-CoA ligase
VITPTYRSPDPDRFAPWWPGRTIADVLAQAAVEHPGALAVVDGDVEITFAALWRRSGRLAHRLSAMGVASGDVVAVQLPNWWETFVAYGAAACLGAVCNPLVTMLRERELSFVMRQARPKVVLIPSRFRSTAFVELYRAVLSGLDVRPRVLVVRPEGPDADPFEAVPFDDGDDSLALPVADADPRAVALLMYTSGTTADPKGVLHHHDSLLAEVGSIVSLFGLDAGDTVFMVSPLSHISGYLFAFLQSAATGATTVLQDLWEPRAAAELVERHRCRFTLAAPVFLRGLVEVHEEWGTPSALRTFMCGGADVPPDLVARGRDILGAEVVRTYGLTEMPTLTSGRPGGGHANVVTDGFVIEPGECRIEGGGTEGELLIRGPELFCGYLDPTHNDAFTDDGYFRTGDLARLGGDGTVTIIGRSKDVIVRNGEKVSAREVEEELLVHPDVVDVAVVPLPDAGVGERVGAFIVARPGTEPDVGGLDVFLRERGLARHKHPERVVLVDELPRTASGKVQKHLLRAAVTPASS